MNDFSEYPRIIEDLKTYLYGFLLGLYKQTNVDIRLAYDCISKYYSLWITLKPTKSKHPLFVGISIYILEVEQLIKSRDPIYLKFKCSKNAIVDQIDSLLQKQQGDKICLKKK